MPDFTMIVDFVEGRMSTKDFESYAYGPEFEALTAEEPAPAYARHADSLYTYAIAINFNSPADVYNLTGTLQRFLESKGLCVAPSGEAVELSKLLSDVQPAWLDVPESYLLRLVEEGKKEQKQDLKEFLKEAIRRDFRCVGKKPGWLQSPRWPIVDEMPLVFVGQLDAGDLFHDQARIYVFFDPRTGQTTNIVQVM